jgi:hypothetical protein
MTANALARDRSPACAQERPGHVPTALLHRIAALARMRPLSRPTTTRERLPTETPAKRFSLRNPQNLPKVYTLV